MKGLFVLVSVVIASTAALECQDSKPPTWPKAYMVKGVITIPYTEVYEPFQAWYDVSKGSSRIDYYGGITKTFQFSNYPGKYGANIKIVSLTNEEVTNVPSCLKTDGNQGSPVSPQAILPNIENFTCIGHGTINGIQAEQWTFSEQNEEKISKYTMWIKWKNGKQGKRVAVPVYYEMRGYNSLLGSHYDHYYLTYQLYSNAAPSKSVWNVPKTMKCTGFPGPGVMATATFNPMKEFIHGDEQHIEDAWINFKETHNKNYNEPSEHAFRRHIFMQNHRLIHSHNRAEHGYKLKLNHLSDRTDDEMKALRGKKYTPGTNGGAPFPYSEDQLRHFTQTLPGNFDWRLYGAVNPVKDQSICGSCWSFGSTGTIEGAYFVKTGKLISLSEQALIDCSWGFGNNGCDGGEDYRSYSWVMKHGGIPLEDEYGQYLGQDGKCHIDKVKLVSPITGWVNVTSRHEKALKLAIFKHGPISISINAALKTFSFYSHGVYFDPKCKGDEADLDHSVLAVGYGVLNGKKYWLVKNSWSNMWGNDGYILIAIKNNNCGVMTSPTYVTM